MERTCLICHSPMKLVPPGISKKTGKAYQAFYSCPNRCKPTFGQPTAPQQGVGIMMDEIKRLDERIDKASQYCVALETRIRQLEAKRYESAQ